METVARQELQTSRDAISINDLIDITIHELNLDKGLLADGMASNETKGFYTALANAETELDAIKVFVDKQTKHIVKMLFMDYLNEVIEYSHLLKKLAIDFVDNTLLVWAEIADDDEQTENSLLLSEASINAKYGSSIGFRVSSTIVEECDGVSIPKHYRILV